LPYDGLSSVGTGEASNLRKHAINRRHRMDGWLFNQVLTRLGRTTPLSE
jgi:hypothetical protein